MPLDHLRQALHLRQKHNQEVEENLNRLKALHLKADSRQALLDGLHPWGAPNSLVFHNHIAIFCYIAAGISLLTFLLVHSVTGHLLLLTLSGILAGLGWLMYESSTPIQTHITVLEHKMLALSYGLQRYQLPPTLSRQMNAPQFLRYITQKFPVLQQGSYSNQIGEFASIPLQWDEQERWAVVFRYDYKDHVQVYNSKTKKYETKIIPRKCWGILFLQQPAFGLIIAQHSIKRLTAPYQQRWQPSDIMMNRKLHFYGASEMQMAKQLSPAFNLKLIDFFQHCQGTLNFHHELNMCCYLTDANLFQVANSNKNIEDISMLRGHLRTLRLLHLEHALQHLEQLLK